MIEGVNKELSIPTSTYINICSIKKESCMTLIKVCRRCQVKVLRSSKIYWGMKNDCKFTIQQLNEIQLNKLPYIHSSQLFIYHIHLYFDNQRLNH